MDDRLLMDNYLLILKSTVEVFVHGTLESSSDDVRSLLKNGLDDIMKSQRDTYDIMTDYGWYTINNVQKQEISNTLTKIESGN